MSLTLSREPHPHSAIHITYTTVADVLPPQCPSHCPQNLTHTQPHTSCKQPQQTYLSAFDTVPRTSPTLCHTHHVNNHGRHTATSVSLTLSPEPHPHSAIHITYTTVADVLPPQCPSHCPQNLTHTQPHTSCKQPWQTYRHLSVLHPSRCSQNLTHTQPHICKQPRQTYRHLTVFDTVPRTSSTSSTINISNITSHCCCCCHHQHFQYHKPLLSP